MIKKDKDKDKSKYTWDHTQLDSRKKRVKIKKGLRERKRGGKEEQLLFSMYTLTSVIRIAVPTTRLG